MFRVDIRDMYDRDKRALNILRARRNPKTHRAEITMVELREQLDIGAMTAWRTINRLEGAGHVKRHGPGGRGGIQLEVLTTDEQSSA